MAVSCDDAVELPKWDYSAGITSQPTDNEDDINNPENTDPNNPQKGQQAPDSVWFQLDKHTHFTLNEYLDSLLVLYPEFEQQKSMISLIAPKNIELDTYSFSYNTKDQRGQETKASALLVVPTQNGEMASTRKLIIDNHATETSKNRVPSNRLSFIELFAVFGHPVVAPDLLGYGISDNYTMNFCCSHLAARNTVDAAMAAQYILSSDKLNKLIKTPLQVCNVGYSMGGYNALALLRYMETNATNSERAGVQIQKTYCGAGPYDLMPYLENAFSRKAFMYSPFVLMYIQSAITYHPEIMGHLKVSDFVTPRVIEKEIPEAIQSGLFDAASIISWNYQTMGNINVADFFSTAVLNKKSSVYSTLTKAADAESLIRDWAPLGNVWFYHHESDDLMPVECTKAAENAYANLVSVSFTYDNTPIPDGQPVHNSAGALFFTKMVSEALKW